jgi:hypothetical protein
MSSENWLSKSDQEKNTLKRVQCLICIKTFVSNRNLNGHMKTGHESLMPFDCYLCDLKFGQKNLQTHIKTVHENQKPFHCKICLQRFS